MRLGVLDIGSNTGHLLVVDAHGGAAPLPASAGGAGMQQVLDSSADPLGMAMIPGGLLFGNAAAASATAGTATGTGSASRSTIWWRGAS